jgi:predicted outer membrane repeat protein
MRNTLLIGTLLAMSSAASTMPVGASPGAARAGDGLDYVLVRADGTGDVPDIQTALEVASTDFAFIELDNGVFTGPRNRNLDFLDKRINLRSLHGDPDSCVIDCESVDRAIFFENPIRTVIVRGITIRNGVGTDGGAIWAEDNRLTVRFCKFVNNQATEDGGAIFGKLSLIADCSFIDNHARNGGAVFGSIEGMTGCRFAFNTATREGGGAKCDVATIANCLFEENVAALLGGGLYMDDGSVSDCEFRGNTARSGGGLAAIHEFAELTLLVTDSQFIRNNATRDFGEGGGAYIRYTTMDGCLFAWNFAPKGGGLYSRDSESERCTFIGNQADEAGAIFGADGRIAHSIFTGNSSPFAYCGVVHDVFRMDCSNCWDNDGEDGCCPGWDDNISEDPLFCLSDSLDFALHSDSPCATAPCGLMGAFPVECGPSAAIPGADSFETLEPPIQAQPNPAFGGYPIEIRLRLGAEPLDGSRSIGCIVEIFDVGGRLVRSLATSTSEGSDLVIWDAREEDGSQVAAGVYVAMARRLNAGSTGATLGTARVVIIK